MYTNFYWEILRKRSKDGENMSRRKKAGILTTLLALVEFGVIPNSHNGFYCNDPSIAFRFMGDTITITTLLLGTFLLPVFFTYVTEWMLLRWQYLREGSGGSEDEDAEEVVPGNVFSEMNPPLQSSPAAKSVGAKAALASTWPWYREFLLGLGVNFLVMDVMKVLVGEPRPHFLDTCRPDSAINCTSGYVQNYKCTNTWDSTWEIRDATKSFPSGHASISVYTALFMMWFIQKRIQRRPSFLLIPFLHCLWITWAMVCSITRIIDHRHHWWDVLGGTLLGIAVTVFTVKSQSKDALRAANREPDDTDFILPRLPTRKSWVKRSLPSSFSGTTEVRDHQDIVLS